MHWSGCPASCGNHTIADIGLLGKNIKTNGEIVEAVDVYAGGAAGCEPNQSIKIMEDVPCEDLERMSSAGWCSMGHSKHAAAIA